MKAIEFLELAQTDCCRKIAIALIENQSLLPLSDDLQKLLGMREFGEELFFLLELF